MEKEKFSLIVPIYKTDKFLKKCIDSIFENAAYENKEVICVLDGADHKCSRILKEYGDKIKVITIPHGGACAARNAGAFISTGDFLSFFSSDFQALPGMIATWKWGFDNFPKADFIYGGYRLNDKGGSVVPSEPFNKFSLRNYPYIDGGFPIKREKYVEWDVNCKSLNDWDWWLSCVEGGAEGAWIPDYTYTAEPPRPGGLSDDSSSNWIERVEWIKRKHKIPINDTCFCSLGAQVHARRVAELVGADYHYMPSFKPHKYKMIYLIGFYPGDAPGHISVFNNASPDCKKVVHWAGTDVWQLHHSVPYATAKQLLGLMRAEGIVQLCEDSINQKELREVGGKVYERPLPADFSHIPVNPPAPNPHFTVGVYDTRRGSANDNENMPLMLSVARALPDIEFIFFGGSKEDKVGNIDGVGWMKMEELIPKCNAYLRFVRHDATSLSNIEFLCAGRPVITNWDMPYVYKLDTQHAGEFAQKEIVKAVRDVQAGKFIVPKEARIYYEKRHDVGKFKEMLERIKKDGQNFIIPRNE